MLNRRTALATVGASLALGWRGAAAENGVSANEIVLGQTAVLSGPLGVPIKAINAGAALAFKQSGPINGRSIRLESMDDGLQPDRAVLNYKTLLTEKKVFAFFACVGSGTTAASASLLQESGVPSVAPYAVADSARRKVLGAAYFLNAGTEREAQALAQHLNTVGFQRIGFAHLANPGGEEAAALFAKALAEHKLNLVASMPVKPDGSDAAAVGEALARQPMQAIVMYLAGDLPAKLIKAHSQVGASSTTFYGMSIVNGEVVARVLGEDFKNGLTIAQVTPYPWSGSDATAIQYRRLADAEGVAVNYQSYAGYLSGLLMVEALKRCGSELTRVKLHQVLRSFKDRVGSMDVDFRDRQALSGSRLVDMVFIGSNGRYTR